MDDFDEWLETYNQYSINRQESDESMVLEVGVNEDLEDDVFAFGDEQLFIDIVGYEGGNDVYFVDVALEIRGDESPLELIIELDLQNGRIVNEYGFELLGFEDVP